MWKSIKKFFNWLWNDKAPWPTDEQAAEANAQIARMEQEKVAREELAAACEEQRSNAQKPLSDGTSKFLRGRPFKTVPVEPETPKEKARAKKAAEKAHELIAKQPKLKKPLKKTVKSKPKKSK